MKYVSPLWAKLHTHQRAALIIAAIVALADTVIVYDLWQAGKWFTIPGLSAAKTAAFILLFIGSLIAEMQNLNRKTRLLLLFVVIVLGGYQAMINIVVNYHGANVPPEVALFFTPWLTPAQVVFWFSVTDGTVRTLVVVLMWLVTGLVWRGVATVSDERQPVQSKTTVQHIAENVQSNEVPLSPRQEQIVEAYREQPGTSVSALAKQFNTSRGTIYKDLDTLVNQGTIARNGRGYKVNNA